VILVDVDDEDRAKRVATKSRPAGPELLTAISVILMASRKLALFQCHLGQATEFSQVKWLAFKGRQSEIQLDKESMYLMGMPKISYTQRERRYEVETSFCLRSPPPKQAEIKEVSSPRSSVAGLWRSEWLKDTTGMGS
jgi:hypothetical protein